MGSHPVRHVTRIDDVPNDDPKTKCYCMIIKKKKGYNTDTLMDNETPMQSTKKKRNKNRKRKKTGKSKKSNKKLRNNVINHEIKKNEIDYNNLFPGVFN